MYIFAYGSLVNQFSRSFTYRIEDAIPVIVDGFIRSWSELSYSKAGISPLVAHKGEGTCNGVLIPVSEEHLHFFDLRERNYKRVKVSSNQILTLNKLPLPLKKTIWIYIEDKVNLTQKSKHSFIFQTYLDTVLAGFLSISVKFANFFMHSTSGWKPIHNDRLNPLYSNYDSNSKMQIKLIDQVINDFQMI